MSNDDLTPARLLSGRDEPSILEQEAILEEVLRQVGAPKARSPWLGFSAAAIASAAVLLLWITARGGHDTSKDEFVARGGAQAGTLALSCVNNLGASRTCRTGTKLALELVPPPGRPFFALLARRPDGAVIWYYPEQGKVMPSLLGTRAGEPWSEAPLVPVDAPPGSYVWMALFADHALSRTELKRALGAARKPNDDVTLIERKLVLERGR